MPRQEFSRPKINRVSRCSHKPLRFRTLSTLTITWTISKCSPAIQWLQSRFHTLIHSKMIEVQPCAMSTKNYSWLSKWLPLSKDKRTTILNSQQGSISSKAQQVNSVIAANRYSNRLTIAQVRTMCPAPWLDNKRSTMTWSARCQKNFKTSKLSSKTLFKWLRQLMISKLSSSSNWQTKVKFRS